MDDIQVQAEILLPLVNKYFDQISAVQWTMLAAGSWDSATQVVLAEMCGDIVQTLTVAVLKRMMPALQEQMNSPPAAGESSVNISLGDTIPKTFAAALNVPQQACQNAQQLTALMEGEVLQRVGTALSAANKTTVLPPQPVLYVPATISTLTSHCSMIQNIVTCLKRFLNKLNQKSFACCWQCKRIDNVQHKQREVQEFLISEEPERCESSQSLKSGISVPAATEAVTGILQKWSSECVTGENGGESRRNEENVFTSSSAFPDAQVAAAEIVTTVIEDLHQLCYGYSDFQNVSSDSAATHFNMSLIMDKVKEFFSSGTDGLVVDQKQRFSHFIRTQFKKTMTRLEEMMRSGHCDFLIDLKSSLSSQPSDAEDDSTSSSFVALKSQRDESKAFNKKTMWKVFSADVETIQNNVEEMFFRFNLRGKSTEQVCKILEQISGEIQTFSRALTDKLFKQITEGRICPIPSFSGGKRYSDSVVSAANRRIEETGLDVCPDVLYLMTEDTVWRFLQQVLLWLQMESLNSHTEEVSGALSDINECIMNLLPENNKQLRQRDLNNTRHTQTLPKRQSSSSSSSNYDSSDDDEDNFLARAHVDSRLITRRVPLVPDTTTCSQDFTFTTQMSGEKFCPASDNSAASNVVLISQLVGALVMKLVKLLPWESRKSMQIEDIHLVIKDLSEYALDQLSPPLTAVLMDNSCFNRVIKAVIKELIHDMHSVENLMESLVKHPNPASYNNLISCLKKQINTLDAPMKRGKIGNFFSRVFAKPPCF